MSIPPSGSLAFSCERATFPHKGGKVNVLIGPIPMSLQLITPPAIEPVTLAGAKLHLKVDTTDDDTLITQLITTARARTEWHTQRALNTQSWILWLDCWPPCGIIEIPLPPLQSVSSVTVYAPDDSTTVLDPATYQVDATSAPARLTL